MSQTLRILGYLLKGKNITAIDALERFGCFRLAARIHDIEARGYTVQRVNVTQGEKTFKKYWIAAK